MSVSLSTRSDVGEFRKRYKYVATFAFLGFLVVFGRLFQLQIVSGKEYAQSAHENIVRRITLASTRGVVRDAHGKILASSRPAYNAYVIPGRAMPSARPPRFRAGRILPREADRLPLIASTLRMNPEELAKLEAQIREACRDDEDKWIDGKRVAGPCWRPILVREDLSHDVLAEVKQHPQELLGVEIVSLPVRYYPYKNLGSHMLGYVAEIDSERLSRFRPPGYDKLTVDERRKINPLNYDSGELIGVTGIEAAWESYLRGQRGWEKRVVDAAGRFRSGPDAERLIDEPRRADPLAGRDLRLTVDIELMQAVESAMREHLTGAVVVVEVRTGRILSMYSKPDFDPNDLSGGRGRARIREAVNRLYPNYLRPLLDKTMSGAFPPGSTFKAFSAIAALEAKTLNPNAHAACEGAIYFGKQRLKCSHVHGTVNMRSAISQSCNIYFYRLGQATGLDTLAKVATEFGLGQKTGLGINPEAAGRIPTRAWYSLRFNPQYYRVGFALNAAIGQGDVVVTPLQLALAYATIGNRGTLYEPQVVRGIETSDGALAQEFSPRPRRRIELRPETYERLFQGLHDVVNDMDGTAYWVRDPSLDISGKTGTAQTGHIARSEADPKVSALRRLDHAWFAALYPAKAPEIAVVVLVEHGESGPKKAAPTAIKIVGDYARLATTRAGGKGTQPAKGKDERRR